MILETFGILFFFGCVILSGALLLFKEGKTEKRFWKWRDDCLNELTEIKVHLKTLAEQVAIFNADIEFID